MFYFVAVNVLNNLNNIGVINLNESTTGADASVEMPKLHNIKLIHVVQYT